MRCVVLYSGGPDSFITLRWAQRSTELGFARVVPIYFDLGHRYNEMERAAIAATAPGTMVSGVLSGLGRWEEDDAFIFARNAFLVLAAARFVPDQEPGTIALTVQEDELSLADRSPEFLERMAELVSTLHPPGLKVMTPWLQHDKTDMVAWYLEQGLPVSELMSTRSCYRGSSLLLQCGNCAACIRRYIAFSSNHIEEEYRQDPRQGTMAREYVDRARRGEYSPKRRQRIMSTLGSGSDEGSTERS